MSKEKQENSGLAPVISSEAIIQQAAAELKLRVDAAQRAIELLDGRATIPFISRYRKEVTNGMDEEQLRQLEKRVAYGRQLAERKATVCETIEGQGKLTKELGK